MQKRQRILELLFPKIRANVLRVLFTKPKKHRSVRELSRLADAALRTIQDELEMLLAAHLITATPWRNGCRRFYKANTEHPMFLHLLGLVHDNSYVREIDLSKLRRIRRVKWKRKPRPEPMHWTPPSRPTGRMYRIKY